MFLNPRRHMTGLVEVVSSFSLHSLYLLVSLKLGYREGKRFRMRCLQMHPGAAALRVMSKDTVVGRTCSAIQS